MLHLRILCSLYQYLSFSLCFVLLIWERLTNLDLCDILWLKYHRLNYDFGINCGVRRIFLYVILAWARPTNNIGSLNVAVWVRNVYLFMLGIYSETALATGIKRWPNSLFYFVSQDVQIQRKRKKQQKSNVFVNRLFVYKSEVTEAFHESLSQLVLLVCDKIYSNLAGIRFVLWRPPKTNRAAL